MTLAFPPPFAGTSRRPPPTVGISPFFTDTQKLRDHCGDLPISIKITANSGRTNLRYVGWEVSCLSLSQVINSAVGSVEGEHHDILSSLDLRTVKYTPILSFKALIDLLHR